MNKAWIAHAALLIVAALYGANYLVAKGLMPDKIGPSGFIVFRVLGALVLFGAMYMIKPEKIQKKHICRFILCGLAGFACNQLLFFNGLNLTSPVHASIIMTINPVLVMIMGAVILKLAITKRQVLGLVIGGVGAIAMLILGAQENVREASLEGNLMVLLNAASYAVYLVLAKPLMNSYRAVTVIFYVFLFGALFVLPIGASQALAVDFGSFESEHWIGLGYVILGTTFLAYLLNIYALQK
ncbi:MAG: DMT family transporter, partial [Bacteroidota bacterium]